MKNILLISVIFFIGCGYTSRQNEAIGQVKKVANQTPLVCPNYNVSDISLGVMINGVGSLSNEDVWLIVENKEDLSVLKKANETGKLVKFQYNVKRVVICTKTDHVLTHVEFLDKK